MHMHEDTNNEQVQFTYRILHATRTLQVGSVRSYFLKIFKKSHHHHQHKQQQQQNILRVSFPIHSLIPPIFSQTYFWYQSYI